MHALIHADTDTQTHAQSYLRMLLISRRQLISYRDRDGAQLAQCCYCVITNLGQHLSPLRLARRRRHRHRGVCQSVDLADITLLNTDRPELCLVIGKLGNGKLGNSNLEKG